jgi:nucleoside-diphosphate-sugar epimerase
MKNLVIGNTSQLSYYFPNNYIKLSSRKLNYKNLYEEKYDRVYLCFADQRTYIEKNEQDFIDINYTYTLEVINFFKNISNKVIVYSTSELWNNVEGPVDVNMPYNYNYSPYIKSKQILCDHINSLKIYYPNIIILYPFNFNSPYRKEGYLFGKIFDSIINEKVIEIGNTDFSRDLIHPSYVVEKSIIAEKDDLIGGGNLININKFIKDLYKIMNMDYDYYVKINGKYNLSLKRKEFFYKTENKCSYESLLDKTIKDIKKLK